MSARGEAPESQSPHASTLVRLLQLAIDNSLLLVVGAVAALVWANVNGAQYAHATYPLHFLVNDVGMAFFFALATKEVYEATLPGGPLEDARTAAVPIVAALGGMAAPALVYVVSCWAFGYPELVRGWAIPCATDIAFSYLVARFVFYTTSPALPFLLLLAIADDALGLLVLALFYPSGAVVLPILAAWMVPAVLVAWLLRRVGVTNFWLYLLGPGVLSWFGLFFGGIHPALALVPIVPFMPHGRSDLALFGGRIVEAGTSTLHAFERAWRIPVQLVLLLFGFVNAGVPIASVGAVTWIIVASLVAGKPIGIVAATLAAERAGFRRPDGLDNRRLVVLGAAAGIGFTVALFFTTAAFPEGPTLDAAKMGALLSMVAALVAGALGWSLRLPKLRQ